MPSSHSTVPTPNPAERSLVVTVEEESFVSTGGVIPPAGTLYSDPAFKVYLARDYSKKFDEFVYTGQVGDHGLAFARNKTRAEASKPFRTTNWKGNHRWPPVLLALVIVEDYGAPRSFATFSGSNIGTGIGPTYYDRVAYIPDVTEGTRFIKDEFFGPVKFNIPQTPVPVPTSVTYNLPGGVNGNFPECLHPEIIIPPAITASSKIVSGSLSGVGTAVEGQVFPATNFQDWAPYILSDMQEQQAGGWYRVRIRVFPPAQPEVIIQ